MNREQFNLNNISSLEKENNPDHASDIFRFIIHKQAQCVACSLIIVTNAIGGTLRAPGALMSVASDGAVAGYVSAGCLEADLIHQAKQVLIQQKPRTVRYGLGSDYRDIKLPCGGTIELFIALAPSTDTLFKAAQLLSTDNVRRALHLLITSNGSIEFTPHFSANDHTKCFKIQPKLRIKILGRGTEAIAVARLSKVSGFEVTVQSPDARCLQTIHNIGGCQTHLLTTVNNIPADQDDRWTACVLMFHDHDWEAALLKQALASDAFYIGALGSARAHDARCQSLLDLGLFAAQIERIHGPIGIIPSMHDASSLAISVLAEIISEYSCLDTP